MKWSKCELPSEEKLHTFNGSRFLLCVDVAVEKETVKYQMMECNCNGVQEPLNVLPVSNFVNRLKALDAF